MKTLALIVTLVLHVTGIWPHLQAHTRNALTAADTAAPVVTADLTPPPLTPTPLPVQTGTESLKVPATGAYAMDAATGTPLFAQNPTKPLPIASITKIMTCLVVLSRHTVDEKVTVAKLPNYQTADEVMGLNQGETYRLGDLVTAALVYSANDAADALALYDAGTGPKFAVRMNAKLAQWGITGAHFASATGLQDQNNFATPEALAKISRLALLNTDIRTAVGLSNATISSTDGRVFNLASTDELLATGEFYGIKTGYTQAAGECFVGLARINGHDVITVVLGADDRFGATTTLTNWIQRNWQWL